MGAIGFAAAKATDPGAGATESFEAQQPILLGRGARCVRNRQRRSVGARSDKK